VPGAVDTVAYAINNGGEIVGDYYNCLTSGCPEHGFVLDKGVYTSIDVPGAASGGTGAEGINNSGDVVGFFYSSSGVQSYVFNTTTSTFTTFDILGSSQTAAQGINDAGQIVGTFTNTLGSFGFLDTGGIFTPIAVPGASYTDAYSINDGGQIVGYSVTQTPPPPPPVPEPTSLTLLMSGLIGLSLMAHYRRA
jgi:uncharacterized membrane protein